MGIERHQTSAFFKIHKKYKLETGQGFWQEGSSTVTLKEMQHFLSNAVLVLQGTEITSGRNHLNSRFIQACWRVDVKPNVSNLLGFKRIYTFKSQTFQMIHRGHFFQITKLKQECVHFWETLNKNKTHLTGWLNGNLVCRSCINTDLKPVCCFGKYVFIAWPKNTGVLTFFSVSIFAYSSRPDYQIWVYNL